MRFTFTSKTSNILYTMLGAVLTSLNIRHIEEEENKINIAGNCRFEVEVPFSVVSDHAELHSLFTSAIISQSAKLGADIVSHPDTAIVQAFTIVPDVQGKTYVVVWHMRFKNSLTQVVNLQPPVDLIPKVQTVNQIAKNSVSEPVAATDLSHVMVLLEKALHDVGIESITTVPKGSNLLVPTSIEGVSRHATSMYLHHMFLYPEEISCRATDYVRSLIQEHMSGVPGNVKPDSVLIRDCIMEHQPNGILATATVAFYKHIAIQPLVESHEPKKKHNLDFATAMQYLKEGRRITYATWVYGSFLVYVPGSPDLIVEHGRPLALAGIPVGTRFQYAAHIDLYTPNLNGRDTFSPWTPQQSEILSNLWILK